MFKRKLFRNMLILTVCTPILQAEESIIGIYNSMSTDTFSQIALLPENKFCFAFSGGDLDFMLAGEYSIKNQIIKLKERKTSHKKYNAFISKDQNVQNRSMIFSGYSLAAAPTTIYGISKNGTFPSDISQILEDDYNGFESKYALPLDDATSIFIGYLIEDNDSSEKSTYEVYQFDVDPSTKSINIVFDKDSIRKDFDYTGKIDHRKLVLKVSDDWDETYIKSQNRIDQETFTEIKTTCIEPNFNPKNQTGPNEILPVKVFTIKLQKPQKSFFKTDDQYKDQSRIIFKG